ncbi:MAG: hypothetical protein ACREGL_03825 [Alphaproteobacteria bacterium]
MGLPEHLRTDEREDVINALEHAACAAETLEERPLDWKWVVIAVHNALQGALVCTLSGTHGTGALSDKSMKEKLEWFEASRTDPEAPCPAERLAPLLKLYERAKKQNCTGEFGGSPLRTTKEQDDDVKRLNNLRSEFTHFTPKGWSIEIAYLPRIVLNAIAIIETLLLSHPANTLRFEPEQTDRIKQVFATLRTYLAAP